MLRIEVGRKRTIISHGEVHQATLRNWVIKVYVVCR